MLVVKRKFLFSIFLLLYVAFHLITLDISPLPWFDETFYTSITVNYIEKGTFYQTVMPLFNGGQEILWYGPIYFWFTSVPVKILGLSIFNFRIVSLLFGFLNIYIIVRLFRLSIKDYKILGICLILLMLDPLFNSSMNSGRMDSVALCFALTSWYLFFSSEKETVTWIKPGVLLLLAGFFAGLAMLTTLRIYFLFISLGMTLVIKCIREKNITPALRGILFGVIPSIMGLFWIYYAFGSLDNFLNQYYYIRGIQKMGFRIATKQYPMFIFTIFSIVYGIFKKGKAYFSDNIIILSVLSVLLFYIVMDDTGPYSFFILPCYYFILLYSFQPIEKVSIRNLKSILIIFLLLWNIGIFTLKSFSLFFTYSQRKSTEITDFIRENIPPGKKVIGDEMYYYSVTKSGSNFQYIHLASLSGGIITQERYQREKYDYDYIIWSDRLQAVEPGILEYYSENSKLEKTESFVASAPQKGIDISRLLGVNIIESYNCRIYRRIKY